MKDKNWLVLILSIIVLGGAGGVYADELFWIYK
mgnify:CR=1 FL=1